MGDSGKITIGIVGVCGGYGRGGILARTLLSLPSLDVRALCDIDREGLQEANKTLGVPELYFDYGQMIEQSKLDAVIIATPMDLHVSQSVAALERGMHVLCEVTAAVSVEQCRKLVAACKASRAVYMLGANLNYAREVVAIRELVRRGSFGTPYYAEGGFVSDGKGLAEVTPWRRRWQLGVNGIPYITHNLGPMLQWLPGERIEEVCCAGSGLHYSDPRGEPYQADATCTMLGRTTSGGQVVIRNDLLSNRPRIGAYNDLQGTDGCYLSPRFPGEPHRIWLKSQSQPSAWEDLLDLVEEALPEWWRHVIAEGSGDECDRAMIADFVNAIRGVSSTPLGIHEAMDLTMPGLISQASIANGGHWLEVPDSRSW